APGLRPGDFVTVRVREASLDNVARLPATAVAADDTVLIVTAEDRLESRPVTVLRRQGDDVIIAAGDLAGLSVVSARTPLLGEGIGVRPVGPAGAAQATEADTSENVALDDARRARLKAFVTDSGMPDDAKARILAQLDADQVPAATVARLESRMGG
ncbi:MAG: efflux transporter periplasmic adaptor subunit, partial [Alphaproteobacteria bacterium]|nr:efflux transporter periplasmic adaptor subunit [Alphaproteobacteria bacterium]